MDPLPGLAQALLPHLRPHLEHGERREYYSQFDSPLGKRRHLAVARSGSVASYKVGRLVLVRRDEMHRFIESHAAGVAPEPDSDDDVLADWDLERGDV